MDAIAFKKWLYCVDENSPGRLSRAREMINIAMREQLTSKQSLYVTKYYIEKQDMRTIARECGVNVSTVSRTIHRAIENLTQVMRYCDPAILHASVNGELKGDKFYNRASTEKGDSK